MITPKMVEEGQSLTETLCKIYHDLNVAYYGNDIVIDPKLDMEWARIIIFTMHFMYISMQQGIQLYISRRILRVSLQ